eukprot:gene4898-5254_t
MNWQPISNDPEEVKSHFDKISSPSKRGQARYRCKKCAYELECTGRGRLIVHIAGQLIPGTQKQVKFCPNPDEGLKEALINFMKTDKFRSRSKFQTKGSRSRPCAENSSPSDSLLGKRQPEFAGFEPERKFQAINSQDFDEEVCSQITSSIASHELQTDSLSFMDRDDLLNLLRILRLMDSNRFDLALSLLRGNHLPLQQHQQQHPGPFIVPDGYQSSLLFSLEASTRRVQHLIQSQNVLNSFGPVDPLLLNTSLQYQLNSMITSSLVSSLLLNPLLYSQISGFVNAPQT